jgi:hypothetical protein
VSWPDCAGDVDPLPATLPADEEIVGEAGWPVAAAGGVAPDTPEPVPAGGAPPEDVAGGAVEADAGGVVPETDADAETVVPAAEPDAVTDPDEEA